MSSSQSNKLGQIYVEWDIKTEILRYVSACSVARNSNCPNSTLCIGETLWEMSYKVIKFFNCFSKTLGGCLSVEIEPTKAHGSQLTKALGSQWRLLFFCCKIVKVCHFFCREALFTKKIACFGRWEMKSYFIDAWSLLIAYTAATLNPEILTKFPGLVEL